MSLNEYHRKRDFARTREPSESGRAKGKHPIFVVQLHHARRRHYDFRLQVGKTLKSWAVPKGPSFDPGVKRLAVEVEDHPLSYANFEGDIREGNYGAGHVDCFDRGTWSTEDSVAAQLRKGHLDFTLHGDRLRGRWHLVRSQRKERQPSWFLIKSKDEYAGDTEADDLLQGKVASDSGRATRSSKAARTLTPAMLAKSQSVLSDQRSTKPAAKRRKQSIDTAFFAPELTKLHEHLPVGDNWLHEIKWDGYRILTAVANGEVRLWSRNALPWNERIPSIVDAVHALGLRSARLDGELVVMANGRSDFAALQKTLSGEGKGSLVYMLFDLIHLDGQDLSHTPLLERKALLKALLKRAKGKPSARLSYSDHIIGNGEAMLAMVVNEGLEGTISKRSDSPYVAGRSGDWIKVKRLDSDEFAIVGYTEGKGSRQGFGSLLLGRASPRGGWDFAGRVGTGFSQTELSKIGKQLASAGAGKGPSVHKGTIDPLPRGAHWVKPTLVAEVYFRGLGGKGLLRQPSIKTLREDKTVKDLLDSDRPRSLQRRSAKVESMNDSKLIHGIAISHPEREVYPGEGISKGDVAEYYDTVMEWFLPGVVGRPLSVLRCPEGIEAPCFFQKHMIKGLDHIGKLPLKEKSGAKRTYLYPIDAKSVIELAQFGVIEFHSWGSTIKQPDLADRIVFDLDPGDDVEWSRVVAAARLTRKLLDKLSLESFVRTTGGKGLHIVMPLKPAAPWLEVETFARSFAAAMAQAHPEEFVAVSTKARRHGRIYVDYLRNSRGATSVTSYSLRARQGAPVAVPMRWEELGKLLGAATFDIRSLPTRLRRLRSDPWEGIDEIRQTLGGIARLLEKAR